MVKMSWFKRALLAGGLVALVCAAGPARATCPLADPELNAYPFIAGCMLPAAGLNAALAAIQTPAQLYGFKNDGTTDNAAALTKLFASTDSPQVFFPAGTYMIGCPATPQSAHSNMSLFGAGQGDTILKLTPSCVLPPSLLAWVNGSGSTTGAAVNVRGLTIDLNGATSSGPAPANVLAFQGISDGGVDHVSVIHGGSGYINLVTRVAGSSGSGRFAITDNFLHLNASSINQNQCVLVSSAGGPNLGGDILRNRCVNSAMDISGHSLTIGDNDITGWGYGSGITTEARDDSYDLTISGNHVHDSATTVDAQGGAGIENWAKNSTITGNHAYNNATGGIANGGKNSIISGNTIFGNGTKIGGQPGASGISTSYIDATFNGSGSVISGNKAFDGGGGVQFYGYYQAASVTGVSLTANDLGGNVTGPLNLNGGTVTIDGLSATGYGAGEALISTQLAANSGSLAWAGLGSPFNRYRLVCDDLQMAAGAGSDLLVQIGEGSGPTWKTDANYKVTMSGSNQSGNTLVARSGTTETGVPLNSAAITVGSSLLLHFDVRLTNPSRPSFFKSIGFTSVYPFSASVMEHMDGAGVYVGDTNPITALRIIPSSGNIAQGSCTLYGMLH